MKDRTGGDRAASSIPAAEIDRLTAAVHAHLVRRTGDPVLAEELTQETLTRVLGGATRLRRRGALLGWARRIASNLWYDHLRRRRASPITATLGALAEAGSPLVESILADDSANQELAVDRSTTRTCLIDVAARLRPGQREVLLLHEFAGMDLAAIAAELGCSTGAAKIRLIRARRRLAELCRRDCVPDMAADGSSICAPRTRTPPAVPGGSRPRGRS